jgi:hypothetical protein
MDYELIFWLASGIVGLIAFGVLYARAKRESYVSWGGK